MENGLMKKRADTTISDEPRKALDRRMVYEISRWDGDWAWFRSQRNSIKKVWIDDFEKRFGCHPSEQPTFYPEGIVF